MSQDRVDDDPNIYNGFPMNTPMDIRLGLTHEDGIHHKLRWGITSASSISSDCAPARLLELNAKRPAQVSRGTRPEFLP